MTGSGAGAIYPPLELQFFNDKGASVDVSIPAGNMVYSAVNGAIALGATVYYSPQ